jgi:lysophospholipase L1-like esterase
LATLPASAVGEVRYTLRFPNGDGTDSPAVGYAWLYPNLRPGTTYRASNVDAQIATKTLVVFDGSGNLEDPETGAWAKVLASNAPGASFPDMQWVLEFHLDNVTDQPAKKFFTVPAGSFVNVGLLADTTPQPSTQVIYTDTAPILAALTTTDTAVANLFNTSSTTRTVADARYLPPVTPPVALFIGDSFTEGFQASTTAKRWSSLISARMGWTEQNYGVGGSGFTVAGSSGAVPAGRTFLAQAQAANAAGVVPNVVVVAGGQNDGATSVSTAAGTFIDYVRSAWPKARIVAVPGFWNATPPTTALWDRYGEWLTVFYGRNIETITGAPIWLFGRPGNMNGDATHPNDSGYALLASFIYQGLTGHDSTVTADRFSLPAASGYTNSDAYGLIDRGIFHLYGGMAKNSGNVAFNDTILNLPAWCAPGIARFVPVFTNGGDNPDLLAKFNPPANATATTATVVISNTQGILNPQLLFPPISWPVGS